MCSNPVFLFHLGKTDDSGVCLFCSPPAYKTARYGPVVVDDVGQTPILQFGPADNHSCITVCIQSCAILFMHCVMRLVLHNLIISCSILSKHHSVVHDMDRCNHAFFLALLSVGSNCEMNVRVTNAINVGVVAEYRLYGNCADALHNFALSCGAFPYFS